VSFAFQRTSRKPSVTAPGHTDRPQNQYFARSVISFTVAFGCPWHHDLTQGRTEKNTMPPSLNFESPMQRQTGFATAGGFRAGDDGAGNFELRDTLAATVVRELSFAEFRAALEKSGKRFI
jgi:hypothetical protein